MSKSFNHGLILFQVLECKENEFYIEIVKNTTI